MAIRDRFIASRDHRFHLRTRFAPVRGSARAYAMFTEDIEHDRKLLYLTYVVRCNTLYYYTRHVYCVELYKNR